MNEKPLNHLQEPILFHHLNDRSYLVNEVTVRKTISLSSWENENEILSIKKEVTDIIFKSDHFIKQLKYNT